MSLHFSRQSSFAFCRHQRPHFHFVMYNGDAYPNWNYRQLFAGHFQTFPSYYEGSATEYTGTNLDNHLDFLECIPDCSSEGTGPWVAVEVSTPNWLLPNIFGSCGNIAQEITKKLPHIRIIMNGNYNIAIDGPLQQVYIAKEFIEHYTSLMNSTTVVDDVPVHRSVHSQIVGKHSARLNLIQKETFTTLYFPGHVKRTGVHLPPDVIRIQGNPSNVAAAKEAILYIAARVVSDGVSTVQVDLSPEKRIERNGKNDELHEQSSGVQVNSRKPGGSSREAALHNSSQKAERCAVPLTEASDDLEAERYCEVLHVDREIVKHIVGQGGTTINKIRNKANIEVQAPGESIDDNTVVVTGKRQNVKEAIKIITDIERKMKKVSDRLNFTPADMTDDLGARQAEKKLYTHYETINLDREVLTKVTGAGCSTITELAEKHDVQIELHPQNDRRRSGTVTISGSESKVKAAKYDLRQIIRDGETYISEWLWIDPSVYGRLIGPKGKKLVELQDELDVIIKFPRPVTQDSPVTIYGRKESVSKAKVQLLALASLLREIDTSKSRTFSKDSSGFMYFNATLDRS